MSECQLTERTDPLRLLTAMHNVFRLDDIIRLIADNIPYGKLGSAVALACCSRSISAPTLDSLWRKQADLGTLLVSTTWKVVNDEFEVLLLAP